MRSLSRALLALVTAAALTGCINSTTLIKVNADGSGTVEQTTLMNMAAVKSMMPGADKQMGGAVINKADLERTAARMGKGVRLLSAEPATGANGFTGTKAIFAFDDINQVQVSQDPNMSGSTSGSFASEPKADDPVRFSLSRSGSTSTLVVSLNDQPGGGGDQSQNPGDGPDLTNPAMMNMIKTMFQGAKIGINLEVAGSIVKTNAEYVTGSRITVLELDLESLLADEAKFKALQSKLGPGASLSEVKPYLRDIKGIKVDGPTIRVEFR